MTTLPAKAGSFSGHARANAPRFVRKAPSEPQYVLSGVNVSINDIATQTAMRPLRERLLDLRHSGARATRLRGVPRVYRDYSHSSTLSLLYEDVNELRPTSIVGGLRKPATTGNAVNVENFTGYQSVAFYQLARLLVVEVLALVSDSLVQLRYTMTSLAASVRALLFPSKPTLRPPELLLSLPVVARRLYGFAIGGDEKGLESKVYADRKAVSGGFGSFAEIAREDRVPLAARLLDRDGLDLALDSTVELDLDVTDMLEVEPPVSLEAAPIAVGWELDGPEPTFGLEARVAGSFPGLHPPKESLKSLVQPSQGSLSGGEVGRREARESPTGLLEPCRLFAIGDRPCFGTVHVPPFAQSEVVEAAVHLKHRIEGFSLGAVGVKPVFEGLPHPKRLYG